MARAPSVILTPAEKKLAVNTAKEAAKTAKQQHAELTKKIAARAKTTAKTLAGLEKQYKLDVATVSKLSAAEDKVDEKALKQAAADMVKTSAMLLKLVPTVAPSQPVAKAEEAVATPTA